MRTTERPVGRPRKPLGERKRTHITLRVRDATREALGRAALENQRSLSEEAEFRIERSFAREDLLADAMELRYGSPLAGKLYMLGEAMRRAGELGGWYASGRTLAGFRDWFTIPYAFDQAARAANYIIEKLRPPGDIWAQSEPPDLAEDIARQLIEEVVQSEPRAPANDGRPKDIRHLLGEEITARLHGEEITGGPLGEEIMAGLRRDRRALATQSSLPDLDFLMSKARGRKS